MLMNTLQCTLLNTAKTIHVLELDCCQTVEYSNIFNWLNLPKMEMLRKPHHN